MRLELYKIVAIACFLQAIIFLTPTYGSSDKCREYCGIACKDLPPDKRDDCTATQSGVECKCANSSGHGVERSGNNAKGREGEAHESTEQPIPSEAVEYEAPPDAPSESLADEGEENANEGSHTLGEETGLPEWVFYVIVVAAIVFVAIIVGGLIYAFEKYVKSKRPPPPSTAHSETRSVHIASTSAVNNVQWT